MANTIGWGKAILNNIINFGLCAVNNTIYFGDAQMDERSWSGETEIFGLGRISRDYEARVIADGGVVESLLCTNIFQNGGGTVEATFDITFDETFN